MKPRPEIVLLRHGETAGQSSIRLHGRGDVALCETGWQQMERARDALAATPFERIVTSPLGRCLEAARPFAAARGVPLEIVEAFREIDFGHWEGLTWAEVQRVDPEGYEAFYARTGDFQFPGGDDSRAWRERVAAGSRELRLETASTSLVLAHKGVIKVLIAALTERPFEAVRDLPIELGSLSRLVHDGATWSLVGHNETAHLGPLRLSS